MLAFNFSIMKPINKRKNPIKRVIILKTAIKRAIILKTAIKIVMQISNVWVQQPGNQPWNSMGLISTIFCSCTGNQWNKKNRMKRQKLSHKKTLTKIVMQISNVWGQQPRNLPWNSLGLISAIFCPCTGNQWNKKIAWKDKSCAIRGA